MNRRPDMAERIGTSINELDIDFSRLSITGWTVSFISLICGGGVAYLARSFVVRDDMGSLGKGLVFAFVIIGCTTITFLALRFVAGRLGLTIIKIDGLTNANIERNRRQLTKLFSTGIDQSTPWPLQFRLLLPSDTDVRLLSGHARDLRFQVKDSQYDESLCCYRLDLEATLLLTLESVNEAEAKLASIANKYGGKVDSWNLGSSNQTSNETGD
ncbi:ribonuclease E inhibitor RraB [Roseiconus sp. JC912]